MHWNPELYNEYKDIRYKPFYDLAAFIKNDKPLKAIDLGCGTGEQTAILSKQLEGSVFLGIDSSPEMLEKAETFAHNTLQFKLQSIEEAVTANQKYNLVFSNAALQWVDGHETLFPKIINLLEPNGQLAIQMPVQNENILNRLLIELVSEEPFVTQLHYFKRESPVLSMDDYAQILFDNGMYDIEILQKVYPIITANSETLYQFIAGTALLPYLDLLEEDQKQVFTATFKKRIEQKFTKYPAIYAFKRILMYARKK